MLESAANRGMNRQAKEKESMIDYQLQLQLLLFAENNRQQSNFKEKETWE